MKYNRVRQLAAHYFDYDMIQQYTELPSFPSCQIQLMLSFLQEDVHHNRRDELYSLVTSLVQVGLDAHDLIEAKDRSTSIQHVRSKQLLVLAGDYLSGRYYELLAHAEEIEAIGQMSEAIVDVNRMKMNLYMRKLQRDLSGEQYLRQLLAIRTRLFLAFEAHIIPERRALWRELLDYGTMFEIMHHELRRLEDIQTGYDGWAVWEILDTLEEEERPRYLQMLDRPEGIQEMVIRFRLREHLEAMIEQTAEQFKQAASECRADTPVLDDMWMLMDQLQSVSSGHYS